MTVSWDDSQCGNFQVACVVDGPDRELLATVRNKRSKVVVATATPDAVEYAMKKPTKEFQRAVEAALIPYRAALKQRGQLLA